MIFPKPHSEEYSDSFYTLQAPASLVGTTDLLTLFRRCKNGTPDLTLNHCDTFAEEEYLLTITGDGISVTHNGDCGLFRAAATLKQLLRKYSNTLPCCRIQDKPDFVKRGYMLEISSCRMPTVKTICALIDYLADLKYNEFQLYIESFVVKYDAFPQYTADFDCLTPQDLEMLDTYCKERFIDFVPNQNGFGHMQVWLAQEEFKHLGITDGTVNTATLNPLLPESLEFMDRIYGSLLPHFQSEYVNIGFDEAYGLGKYQTEEICREQGIDTVFLDYLNKTADMIASKYHKKVQFWADMLYEHPKAYERLPEGAVAMAWGYDMIKSALMETHCKNLADHGVRYYVCPGTSNWMSLTGRFDVMNFNLRTLADAGRSHGAYGYLLTDWGCDDGHVHFPVWSLVPIALAAQYAWNVGVAQNGGMLKTDYVYSAEQYVDETIFHAPVARKLYRLQQYYLLEPERIHSGSLCFYMIRLPLQRSGQPGFFDLKTCGDRFYFENVLSYIQKAIADVEALDFDEKLKRQVLVNSRMVLLGAELALIRLQLLGITDTAISGEKIQELIALIDALIPEYTELWDRDNFPKGKEFFINLLAARRNELHRLHHE